MPFLSSCSSLRKWNHLSEAASRLDCVSLGSILTPLTAELATEFYVDDFAIARLVFQKAVAAAKTLMQI